MPVVHKIEPPIEPVQIDRSQVGTVHLLDVLLVSHRPRPLSEVPKIGDVVRLKASPGTPDARVMGVVTRVWVRRDGIWTHVELLMHDGSLKVSKSTIAAIIGRPKGVSRIDQPKKLLPGRVHGATHGWFVRLYEGKKHKITGMFSDNQYGGIAESLKAALLFHALETRRTSQQL